MQKNYNVVIVGGGIIGSATAYFLAADPLFTGNVAVIEKDPCYLQAATTLSASSIRLQFSSPVNIMMSQFGISFLRNLGDHLAVDGDCPNISLIERGYLFLASRHGLEILDDNIGIQRAHGVDVKKLDPVALSARFPWLDTNGIVCGATTDQGEGWFDAYSLLQAFRAKAKSLGVHYIKDQVTDIVRGADGDVSGVVTCESGTVGAEWVVNAAGTFGYRLAEAMGVNFPVRPRKRCVFVFKCRTSLPDCPLVIDPSGLYFRSEGDMFICGLPPTPDIDVDEADFNVDYNLFNEQIWPILAVRVPAFEAIKLCNFWAGHYDYNKFDQNAFLGPMPNMPHFLVANGFSGHGLQQAPAVGRGLTELITCGRYQTLDLSALGYDRFLRNEPVLERNVI